MKFYFAPMEGVTNFIYRNAYHQYFHACDKYFAPFISPNQNRSYNNKELRDILPENNKGINLIPQILTNNADYFIKACKDISEFGYDEINLNLGCPSGTVVSKHKGSGFLAKPDWLEVFLDKVFSELDMKISIKTRIGKEDPEEFYRLMEIYNQYPLEELIIHPRIQTDFYRNKPNLEIFSYALKNSKNPVCYNGDIFSIQNYHEFCQAYPEVDMMMLGRGLITNPFLINELVGDLKRDKNRMKEFHDTIYETYHLYVREDKNVLFRMKELWFYMGNMFCEPEKHMKKIRKSERLVNYEEAVSNIFLECELVP